MNQLEVGATLRSIAEFDRLPIGTVIVARNNSLEYEKRRDGWWAAGRCYTVTDFSMGYNTIKSMPTGKDVAWESLAQWQFKYRDNCYMSAEQAGVSYQTVHSAMAELGIGDDHFPLGKGVVIGSKHDRDRLPLDTQITVGQPEVVHGFGLFVKSQSGWVHLLGDVNRPDGNWTLVVSGPDAEWATTPGTEAEQEALANFKARAWRIGWKVKTSHRWCESYEQYMGRIGLTEAALEGVVNGGLTIGEKTNPRGAAALPVGSLLRWHHRTTPNTFTWYVRDDTMNNESRTRALFGHRQDDAPLRNTGATMEVMWIPNDEDVMSIRVDNLADIWPYVPPGTLVSLSGVTYVVAADHRVSTARASTTPLVIPATGDYSLEQMGDNVRIAGFPS